MKKARFDIQGMTCSSCSAHIDKSVNQLNGVKNVSVNLLSNNMTLEYEENVLTENDIIKAVEKAGYGASLSQDDASKEKKNRQHYDQSNYIFSIKKRFLLSLVFLIALMLVSMHEMVFHILHIPTPTWISTIFSRK